MAAESERLRERTRELEENQRRLAFIFDTVRDVIFHLAVEPDGQFRFVSVNAAFLRVTGLSWEAVVGRTVSEVIPEPSLTMVLGKYRLAIEGKTTVLWEETSDYPTGRLTGEVGVTPVFDNAGKCTHLVGSVHDITERKRDEAALRESEERFRKVADRLWESEAQLKDAQRLAKVGSWERPIEAEGNPYWSEEMLRIVGLPDGSSADFETFLGYVHPKDQEKVLEAEREVRLSVAPIELEYRIIRPDGQVRFVRSVAEAIREGKGGIGRIIGATQDITELVEVREILRESEERLKNAERLAHLGHWNWDAKSNKATCSEEYCRIYGQPMDYAPSFEEFLNAVVPQDRERVGQVIRDALRQKTGYTTEFQIVRPTGEFRTVRTLAELLLDDKGLPAWLSGTCQDITDLRRAQEESAARQKLESVGTLASGIAHDFNNLLGSVLAEAELALAELSGGLHPKEELRAIQEVALRGSEIVRQLMVYAGKESATVGPVDISQIVQEMIELLKVSVSKHARLETDLGKDLPAVQADAAQLRQIVMNLVTNASEAIGDRDGVIRVTTRYLRTGRGSSGHLADNDYVQLEVSDTGRGMFPGVQARVFDPFFTTKSAGHGLGLAIVDGIVRGLQGKIHLASEPGKGTTFQILLPCGGVTTIPHSLSPVEDVAHFSEWATVLVVEDEEILRQAAAKVLRTSGFEVLEAPNGSAAIDVLRASGSKIDVILLDMTIPGPSSHEVVAEYAKARSDAKVILTSAYSEERARAAIRAPQVRGFIRKPFHLEVLVKILRNTLSS